MNNLDHDSLLTIGSITDPSFEVDAGNCSLARGDVSACETSFDGKSSAIFALDVWQSFTGGASGSSAAVSLSAAMFGQSDSFDPVAAACFGLKKPFRFCCPLAGVLSPELTLDFERFSNGREVSLFRDLFLEFGVADGTVSGIDLGLGLSCTAFEAPSASAEGGCVLLGPSFVSSVTGVFGASLPGVVDGFRKNMSLIFLRRSNSGISLPDRGNIFFGEYSFIRSPFSNIPFGFMISRRLTSLSSNSILSLNVA